MKKNSFFLLLLFCSLSCTFIFVKEKRQLDCIDSSSQEEKMKIYAYFTRLFRPYAELTMTDYKAYLIFKEHPIKKKVNYLTIPWRMLIKRKQLYRIPNIHIDGGFTICMHPFYERILPIIKRIGIDTVFAPHARKNQTYEGIKILPFPIYPINGIGPAPQKDILYSFVGSNCHPYVQVRTQLFQMPTLKNCVIKERDIWHYLITGEQRKKEKEEYQDILARSRYSICPRGTGPSSIRFWESLQAGAIPVVIADDLWLPEGINWDECIVRIAEKDVHTINEVIQSIPYEQELIMRENCLKAAEFFAGNNFVSNVRSYYEEHNE